MTVSPYVFLHQRCKQPSFRLLEKPAFGSRASSDNISHLDGSKMHLCAAIMCESCGRSIGLMEFQSSCVVREQEQ